MPWGRTRIAAPPPVWDPSVDDDVALVRLFEGFDDLPPEGEDADEEALGDLIVVAGWANVSGPGWAMRVSVRPEVLGATVDKGLTVEVRLRASGRFIRSELRTYADKDCDITLCPELVTAEEGFEAIAFLPYAALPARLPDELAVDVQLSQDGDPIDDRLYRLPLPPLRERLVAGPFGAVGLAARAVCPPEAVPEVVRWLGLDAAGRATFDRLWAKAPAVDLDDVASNLRNTVHEDALAAVVESLARWADARVLRDLAGRIGSFGKRAPADPELVGHYRALGLAPGADLRAVRAAYRRLARDHHPDCAGIDPQEAHARMSRINTAYAAITAAARARRA